MALSEKHNVSSLQPCPMSVLVSCTRLEDKLRIPALFAC